VSRAGRGGFAVLLALFSMILLGAIAVAMLFAANAATRASGTMLGVSRSLSAAEAGAWSSIASFDWTAAMLLAPGQFLQVQQPAGSGYAVVSIVRLDSTCFFVQASASDPPSAAQNARFIRRVGITIEVVKDSTGAVRPVKVPERAWTELF
jgi:hypothetical protein